MTIACIREVWVVAAAIAAIAAACLLSGGVTPIGGFVVGLSGAAAAAAIAAGLEHDTKPTLTFALAAAPSVSLVIGFWLRGSPESKPFVIMLAGVVGLYSATRMLHHRKARRCLWGALLVFFLGVTVAATVARHTATRISGPFVNPDHFAGLLEIGLSLFAGLVASYALAPGSTASKHPAATHAPRFLRIGLAALGMSILATGIILTQSRGAILAALCSLAAIAILTLMKRRRVMGARVGVAIAATLSAGAVLLTISMAGHIAVSRLQETDIGAEVREGRIAIWATSLQAWRRSPMLGTGLGSYADALRTVQPRKMKGLIEHAHSDPVELLVTGGILGFAAGFLLWLYLLWSLVSRWLRQPHREESAIALGGIGALISLSLHSLVEFNMFIPAIPATLAVVLGTAQAAARWKPHPTAAV